jgi:hypothetical protein
VRSTATSASSGDGPRSIDSRGAPVTASRAPSVLSVPTHTDDVAGATARATASASSENVASSMPCGSRWTSCFCTATHNVPSEASTASAAWGLPPGTPSSSDETTGKPSKVVARTTPSASDHTRPLVSSTATAVAPAASVTTRQTAPSSSAIFASPAPAATQAALTYPLSDPAARSADDMPSETTIGNVRMIIPTPACCRIVALSRCVLRHLSRSAMPRPTPPVFFLRTALVRKHVTPIQTNTAVRHARDANLIVSK